MKIKSAKRAASFAEAAFEHYGAQLHRFLLRRLRHPHDAEDLAQEVFMRLSRIENGDFVRQPRAYLFGVASHVACEFEMRAGVARECITFDSEALERQAEHPGQVAPDDLAEQLDTQRQLREALAQLTAMHLTVFLLHKRDGYSYDEIGQKLELPARKIESYLAEAKAQLRMMKWDR